MRTMRASSLSLRASVSRSAFQPPPVSVKMRKTRPSIAGGAFKTLPNQAGMTLFVEPALVAGTLREGWRRLVDTPLRWSLDDLHAQDITRVTCDIHCVTTWSTYDNEWMGISFKHLISVVKPLTTAKFVLFQSYDDYTTNLPLEACDDDDVFLVHRWNGKPLPKEHGGPVRMIVPKRYAWKGAKWVREIRFSDRDEKGFWEVRGYSNSAFPWQNDRYG